MSAQAEMSGITCAELLDNEGKSAVCQNILRALPLWFGIEASILEYGRQARQQRLYAAYDGGQPIGFVMLKRHNRCACEVSCMGVLQPYHRRGIGRELIGWCVRESEAWGARFLTVKTLADLDPDVNYAKTRLFYESMGFWPLEVFETLWGAENPCVFLVKVLG